VVGWRWHQAQQRGDGGSDISAIDARLNDVALMYETPSEEVFLELARSYSVEYIYVGPTERTYFDAGGLAKFDRMAESPDSAFEVFYRGDEVSVYRLHPDPTGRQQAGENGLNGSTPDDSLPVAPQPGDGEPMESSSVQIVRDILLSVYLVAGIVFTLVLIVAAFLLFRTVRGLLRSITRTADNVGKLTESIAENVVSPLSEGISGTTTAGRAMGFASGFLGSLRRRGRKNDKDDDRGRRRR
jgi:hypothetical protein